MTAGFSLDDKVVNNDENHDDCLDMCLLSQITVIHTADEILIHDDDEVVV